MNRAGRPPLTVVAFGGNALLQAGDMGTVEEQTRRADEAARWLAMIAAEGDDLVLVHGNGPQVGQVMIQMEEAATKVPPGTLDLAVAQTQGSIGLLLELALRNRMRQLEPPREVAIVLSLALVDAKDPGFAEPTKPVGPFFNTYRARALQAELGWRMVEDSGRGWRKVVASPRPLEVLGVSTLRRLLELRAVVIAGGGGGVPVVRRADGRLVGVEAVIDKDWTACLVAQELDAERLVILTETPAVYRDFGTEDQQELRRLTVDEARALAEEGHFPPGNMGPKIAATTTFAETTGRIAVITDADHLPAALAGESGTTVVPN